MKHLADGSLAGFSGPDGARQYFQSLVFLGESTDDYLFVLDIAANRNYFTGHLEKRFALPGPGENGYSDNQWLKIVYQRDVAALQRDLQSVTSGRSNTHNLEYRLVDREGNLVWISCRGKSMRDENGVPIYMIGRVSETAMQGKIDPLTGLRNGQKLTQDLAAALKQNQTGILLLLGLDDFKRVNTKYGRGYGNTLLKQMANLLEAVIDEAQAVYRLDGDRFAVNFVGGSQEQVLESYQTLKRRMPDGVTISAGAVHYPTEEQKDESTLFLYAESAMDRAKRRGKNRLLFFSAEDYEKQLYLIDLNDEMRRSIQNDFDGFALHYQPQISTRDGTVYGAEALLRYTSVFHGAIRPEVFIPLLEQTGMILEVGSWVLREAVFQCKKWRMYDPNFHISVNLSYLQLQQKDLSRDLYELLDQAGLPGDALTLELTERVQLQDYPLYNRLFAQWGRRGIRVSIDDFGTGYSSLGYLKNLAIDEVKIDRCFVTQLNQSAYNYRLLRNMLELAHSAQIQVCCEGVETQEELRALQRLQPETMQGFFFARAMPAAQFTRCCFLQQDERKKWSDALQRAGADNAAAAESGQSQAALCQSILDQLDMPLCLEDPDSKTVYYKNPAAARLCAEMAQDGGSQEELSLCGQHPGKQGHLLVQEQNILWDGHRVRLAIGVDTSALEAESSAAQEQQEIDAALVEMLIQVDQTASTRQAVQAVLRCTGAFYEADDTLLYLYDKTAARWTSMAFWSSRETGERRQKLTLLPDKLLGSWGEALRSGQSVVVRSTDAYKHTERDLWLLLRNCGARRLLLAPLCRGETLVGAVGVSNAKHLSYDLRYLHTAASFLTNMVWRKGFLSHQTKLLEAEAGVSWQESMLRSAQLGLWESSWDAQQGNRLHIDQTMNNVLELDLSLNDRERYQEWYSRLPSAYHEHLASALREMQETGKPVGIEFLWNHPRRGEVRIRAIGRCCGKWEDQVVFRGYHFIADDVVIHSRFGGDRVELFVYDESKHRAYFPNGRSLVAGTATEEADFPACWVEQGIVHPYFIEDFRRVLFAVREYHRTRYLDLLLKSQTDAFEWFRMDVQRMDKDENCALVSLQPIRERHAIQLQYVRKDDFYQAMLSETSAYAEVDLHTDMLQSSGGLWAGYVQECRTNGYTFQQFTALHVKNTVAEEDQKEYARQLSPENMRKNYEAGRPTVKHQFRRKTSNNHYRWMELVIHTFREQASGNMYALLYLKDIHEEKRRQLEQERAASRDPLTNVLNRRIFSQHATAYMQNEAADTENCALLLLDLDDFKSINDTRGHQYGDRVLKTFASALREEFRGSDYIGRFGGDEFIIFVKNCGDRQVLSQRLVRLMARLAAEPDTPVRCSAGVTLVQRKNFSLGRSLYQADKALYASKGCGKATFAFWEDLPAAHCPETAAPPNP